jgi:hypothetical protein
VRELGPAGRVPRHIATPTSHRDSVVPTITTDLLGTPAMSFAAATGAPYSALYAFGEPALNPEVL